MLIRNTQRSHFATPERRRHPAVEDTLCSSGYFACRYLIQTFHHKPPHFICWNFTHAHLARAPKRRFSLTWAAFSTVPYSLSSRLIYYRYRATTTASAAEPLAPIAHHQRMGVLWAQEKVILAPLLKWMPFCNRAHEPPKAFTLIVVMRARSLS